MFLIFWWVMDATQVQAVSGQDLQFQELVRFYLETLGDGLEAEEVAQTVSEELHKGGIEAWELLEVLQGTPRPRASTIEQAKKAKKKKKKVKERTAKQATPVSTPAPLSVSMQCMLRLIR